MDVARSQFLRRLLRDHVQTAAASMEGHTSLSTALVNVYHKHLIYTTYIERTPRKIHIKHIQCTLR